MQRAATDNYRDARAARSRLVAALAESERSLDQLHATALEYHRLRLALRLCREPERGGEPAATLAVRPPKRPVGRTRAVA
jgi:hypothetical protein